jgi:hypothetical protein
MLNAGSLMETGILEKIIVGIPRVAKAIEDLPVEQLWKTAIGARWRNTAFSQSDCHALTSAITRRLKGQLGADGLTEKEMMIRLCEELRRYRRRRHWLRETVVGDHVLFWCVRYLG